MNKIAIILPYFGKLPSWTQLFLHSVGRNKECLDLLLFTDDRTSLENICIPANVRIEYMSFDRIQELFRRRLNRPNLCLESPYKLCDYKPCYGYVFEEYTRDYRFWAHCDLDLIFGDVSNFLKRIEMDAYDRIFPLGHFSIYRNCRPINTLFLHKAERSLPRQFDFDFVCRTTFPCHYDEVGINYLLERRGGVNRFFRDTFHLNISMWDYRLTAWNKRENDTLIFYRDGKIILQEFDRHSGTPLGTSEYIYIHLQNRKSLPAKNGFDMRGDCLITCEGFVPLTNRPLTELVTRYSSSVRDKDADFFAAYKKNISEGQKRRIITEVKYNGIRSLYTIYQRLVWRKYLQKNGLF